MSRVGFGRKYKALSKIYHNMILCHLAELPANYKYFQKALRRQARSNTYQKTQGHKTFSIMNNRANNKNTISQRKIPSQR